MKPRMAKRHTSTPESEDDLTIVKQEPGTSVPDNNGVASKDGPDDAEDDSDKSESDDDDEEEADYVDNDNVEDDNVVGRPGRLRGEIGRAHV